MNKHRERWIIELAKALRSEAEYLEKNPQWLNETIQDIEDILSSLKEIEYNEM